jgi:hypothetical protein
MSVQLDSDVLCPTVRDETNTLNGLRNLTNVAVGSRLNVNIVIGTDGPFKDATSAIYHELQTDGREVIYSHTKDSTRDGFETAATGNFITMIDSPPHTQSGCTHYLSPADSMAPVKRDGSALASAMASLVPNHAQ